MNIGIIGGDSAAAGELIRILLNHPDADIAFVHSVALAGVAVAEAHYGLWGDTDLVFTADLPFTGVDVVFMCLATGQSRQFLLQHQIPASVKIIDLAGDFRVDADGSDYVYGLPETHRTAIVHAQNLTCPGPIATSVLLALLPAAEFGLLRGDVVVNTLVGTSVFTGVADANNIGVVKPFCRSITTEIMQGMVPMQPDADTTMAIVPSVIGMQRGVMTSVVLRADAPFDDVTQAYNEFYANEPFTHCTDMPLSLQQVLGTNKCLVNCMQCGDRLLVTSCLDNMLKGSVGQAVQDMNIMFDIDEMAGLRLKASAL